MLREQQKQINKDVDKKTQRKRWVVFISVVLGKKSRNDYKLGKRIMDRSIKLERD